jgi:regulator of protease activity HflC (stomatin/prohibitin superfamily)
VIDAYKASYGIEEPEFAVTQLAQTTMRAEIGQMTLDRTLAERQQLNANIVEAINAAAADWGIRCLRYEIRDIHPPERVLEAMHSQVSAERQKRADILASEGDRQAQINRAEAARQEAVNIAKGQAEAVLLNATAQAEAITKVADAIAASPHSHEALRIAVAEKYIDAFRALAKESTTVLMDSQKLMTANGATAGGMGGVADVGGMVASALSVYDSLKQRSRKAPPASTGSAGVDAPSLMTSVTSETPKSSKKTSDGTIDWPLS